MFSNLSKPSFDQQISIAAHDGKTKENDQQRGLHQKKSIDIWNSSGGCSNTETSEIKKRFDDTLRTLFIITSVMISVVIGFFKDSLGLAFVMDTFLNFLFSVILWSLGNIMDGSKEYLVKLTSWHLFIYTLAISLARMAFNQLLIPPIVGFLALAVISGLTLALARWFQNEDIIPEEDPWVRRTIWLLGAWTVSQVASITLTW